MMLERNEVRDSKYEARWCSKASILVYNFLYSPPRVIRQMFGISNNVILKDSLHSI